jgi:hypothetical protein
MCILVIYTELFITDKTIPRIICFPQKSPILAVYFFKRIAVEQS